MENKMRRTSTRIRWIFWGLLLLAFPYMSVSGSEEFSDFTITNSLDRSLLLFPAHKITEILVQRPLPNMLTVDIPSFSFPNEPKLLVAPHPKIRLARVSQVSADPAVVRASFIFHPGAEMSPVVKEGHLYLEETPAPGIQGKRTFGDKIDLPLKAAPAPKSLLDQTVNLQFENEDLLTILNALALKFGLRVFADAGVKGKFTINAREVPLREVLKNLLLQKNFQYTLKGQDLTVISLGQAGGRIARELLFKDLSLKDALQTLSKMMNINLIIHESVPDKKVNFYVENLNLDELLDLLISTNDLEKKAHNENTYIIIKKDEAKKYGEKQYRTFKLVNAKPDEVIGLIKNNKALAEKINLDNIAINERINAFSVYDTPENLELIAKVIADNDEKLKQAVIELKLIEINRDALKSLGISLDKYGFGVADINRLPKSVSFAAQVEFIENQNKAKVLSSPKIRAVHGKKATIHIGETIPVPKFTYEVASLTLNTLERKTYTDVRVGIELTVTPEITRDNEISLELDTKVDSVLSVNADGQIHRSDKTTNTYVRIKDGETVVLGGLISNDESTRQQGPALLNKIPLFKSLLTQTKVTNQEKELIILVTPHLVNLDEETESETTRNSLYVESK